MTCTSRQVESRIALLIAHAKIGPRGEQVFRNLQMARSRRAHQRRSAAEAAGVHGPSARKQDHDEFGVAGFGGPQYGAVPGCRGTVALGAGAEELPNRLRRTLANRNVEQRLSVRASAVGIEARFEEKTQRVRPPPCSRGTQGSTPRRLRCSRGQQFHEVVVCIADRHFE